MAVIIRICAEVSWDHGICIELCRLRGQVGPGELCAHQLLQHSEDDTKEVLQEQEQREQGGRNSGENGGHAQRLQVRHANVCAEEGGSIERKQKVLGGGQGPATVGRAIRRRVCD